MNLPKIAILVCVIIGASMLSGCVEDSSLPTPTPGSDAYATLVAQALSTPTSASAPKTPIVQTPITSFNAMTYQIKLAPSVQKPAPNTAYMDPQFGTRVTRISDARSQKLAGVMPEYSRRQAWNANESLMLLHSGDGSSLLYDGVTYQYKKVLSAVNGQDIFWHPTDPALIFFNPENVIYSYNVNTGEQKKLYTFADYKFVGTRAEGGLSRDGRWYTFVGQVLDPSTQEYPFRDLGVFDMTTNQIAAKLALPKNLQSLDWISISPLGNFVVVDYADTVAERFHGVEVYDRNFKLLWQKPLGAGHSDLAIDADGSEVLIMDVYDPQKNVTQIKKYWLADRNKETVLLEVSSLFDLHISCQNQNQAGLCFISTFDYVDRLTHDPRTWLTFEDEVFSLKLDGSGEVQRIAHHHSRRFSPTTPDSDNSVYWAEPHATVSRNGDRVLFGSNWEQDVEQEAGVDAYIIDLRK